MVKIHMYKAFEGDFIRISYGNEKNYSHILIDGGTKECSSKYAEVIEQIAKVEQTIEAIVLTHVDCDHIAGACAGLAKVSSEILQKTVKSIFFNVSEKIHEEIMIKANSKAYAIKDGIQFIDMLEKKGIKDRIKSGIISGQTICLNGNAVLKIISPGEKELEKFLANWEKYEENHSVKGYAANVEQIKYSLDELVSGYMGSDASVNNASSIAFLFEYADVKGAFLADAKTSVCIEGLEKHGIKEKYPVDFIKISHHGSMANTNEKLLSILSTENYLLSTNGNACKVPAKAVIAKLVSNSNQVKLYCNYDWWETVYHRNYFTDKDKKRYLDTKRLQLGVLDDMGTEIKDGLYFYENGQIL